MYFTERFAEGNIFEWPSAMLDMWRDRWPNFAPSEFSSYGGAILIDTLALDALQEIRNRLGRPMTINCGYRTPAHNKAVKGARKSQHMLGTAFDIHIRSQAEGDRIERWARELGFTGIGRYHTFIHIDMRSGRRASWDKRT